MSEAQTVDNLPESMLKPKGNGHDRLSQIAAKHLANFKAGEADVVPPKPTTPEVPVEQTPTPSNGEDKVPVVPEPATEKPPEVKSKETSDSLEKKRSIIRRENQLRKKFEAVKQYEAEKAQFEEYKRNLPQLKEYEEIKRLAKENPTLANEKLGISYDKWTQHLISESSKPKSPEQLALDQVRAELDGVKKTLETKDMTLKQRDEQAAIQAFRNETAEAIQKEVDKYELILLNNQVEGVINLRANEAYRNKSVPSVERVAGYAESRYEKEWVPKVVKSKKIQAAFIAQGWKPPQSLEVSKPVVSQSTKEPRTLSTELTTGSSPKPAQKAKNRDERLAQIIREHNLT